MEGTVRFFPRLPPELKYFAGYVIAFLMNFTSPFLPCVFRSAMSDFTSKETKVN